MSSFVPAASGDSLILILLRIVDRYSKSLQNVETRLAVMERSFIDFVTEAKKREDVALDLLLAMSEKVESLENRQSEKQLLKHLTKIEVEVEVLKIAFNSGSSNRTSVCKNDKNGANCLEQTPPESARPHRIKASKRLKNNAKDKINIKHEKIKVDDENSSKTGAQKRSKKSFDQSTVSTIDLSKNVKVDKKQSTITSKNWLMQRVAQRSTKKQFTHDLFKLSPNLQRAFNIASTVACYYLIDYATLWKYAFSWLYTFIQPGCKYGRTCCRIHTETTFRDLYSLLWNMHLYNYIRSALSGNTHSRRRIHGFKFSFMQCFTAGFNLMYLLGLLYLVQFLTKGALFAYAQWHIEFWDVFVFSYVVD
ncbi:hypothetical protein L596_026502 [Steinernema carpocapsae]|uniref:Uncharacterized protein n=1 Tax=Steinernema carpocapsae TaxID=34508 RepID=A0A4U5M1J7_STECR|nr:hypothetical protein L596_026502 [Steinernema carpocapsae]